MERFKKALDKARSERAAREQAISPDLVRDNAVEVKPAVATAIPDTPNVPEIPDTPNIPEVPDTPNIPEIPEVSEFIASTTNTLVHPQDIVYTQTKTIKIPKRVMKKNHLIGGAGVGPEMDAYRMLRTNLMQILRANNWNSLAITSTRSGEGKTLTAINLAISMAMDVNHTVLLVDMDLRRPSIHRYLNYNHKKGISEFITEDIALENLLITPAEIQRLVILPGNKAFTHSSEIMSLPKMVRMIEEIKTRYPDRYIIFDLPPILSTDDALVFSQHTDAYLLVIEEGKTQEEDLRRVKEITRTVNVIGTVLNKSTEVNKNYYYV